MGEPQQKPHIQWLIKNKNGKISGPYSTEAVLKLISQNIFTGNEEVSLYPGGKWMEISREPQFYDQLLSALEGLVKKNPDEEKMNAETVIQVPVTQKRKTDSEDTQSKESKNESTRTEIASSLPKKGADFSADDLESSSRKRKNTEAGDILALLGTRNPNVEIASKSRRKSLPPLKMGKGGGSGPIIDLEDLTKVKKQNIKKSAKLPMIFVAIALGLAVFAAYFLQDSTGIQEKIRLLAPRQNGTPLSSEDVKEGFSPAVSNFIADRFENYLNAQNQLVRLVEGSPQNTEIRGFLCLVYRELWPFAFQDSEDIRTLSFMAQSTRALNPIGLHGNICEAVKMSATGRYAEAKSVIESALNDPEYGKDPILHQLYGEIIYGEKDYKVASAWIDKAQKLWPDWIKPIMVQGQIQVALHKFPEAAALFRSILNRVPSHMGAKVELALIEMKEFKQVDTAFELLNSAFSTPGKVNAILTAKGYFALAEIYLLKGQRGDALAYAQKSYALNSTNREVQEFVVRLGGDASLKQTDVKNSEIVFLGDQYFRAGDYFAAQAEYKAAFEADPKNGLAAMKAGQSLWELNQGREAIEYMEKAIGADPKLLAAYVLQADYYSQRYDYISAARTLNRARTQAPNSHEVLRGFALIELRRNNFATAIVFAKKALSIYDTDVETLLILAKSFLGQKPIRDSQEIKDAFKFAVKAAELDATNREA
ncbi:MAG: tetratricopeptide repeat protein, partial [Pseudobdellovibrionaceae bacterium]